MYIQTTYAQVNNNIIQNIIQDNNINPPEVIQWIATHAIYDSTKKVIYLPLRLISKEGFSVYQSKLEFFGPTGTEILIINAPASKTIQDPITKKDVEVYDAGDFELWFNTQKDFSSQKFINVQIKYTGCSVKICLFPYTQTLSIPLILEDMKNYSQESNTNAPKFFTTNNFQPKSESQHKEGLLSFIKLNINQNFNEVSILLLVAIFLGGLLTNLTPCVYPMIPITIRLLSNQNKFPVIGSSLYALGIVITYTSLGLFAALSGSMFGQFMANPYVNSAFAIIMFAFALSFLGFWDFGILQNLGYKISSKGPIIINNLLMGIGAGFVASPCTGPILAGLLTYTAQKQNILLGTELLFVYSIGFALPYMILGIFSSKVSKIKISQEISFAVKILFACVMFALSFYYLKIPLYFIIKHLKMFWSLIFYLSLINGIFAIIIWIKFKFLQKNKFYILIPTIILGLSIFSFVEWLSTPSVNTKKDGIAWLYSQEKAFELAKTHNKPILIDNWAEWCSACKEMDISTFNDPELIKEINQNWIALKMDLTEDTNTNAIYQQVYDIQGLPTIILMSPSADINSKQNITGFIDAKALLEKMQKFKITLFERE